MAGMSVPSVGMTQWRTANATTGQVCLRINMTVKANKTFADFPAGTNLLYAMPVDANMTASYNISLSENTTISTFTTW